MYYVGVKCSCVGISSGHRLHPLWCDSLKFLLAHSVLEAFDVNILNSNAAVDSTCNATSKLKLILVTLSRL